VFYDSDVFEYIEDSLIGYGDFINKVEFKSIATKSDPFIPGDGSTGPNWIENTSGISFLVDHTSAVAAEAREVATLTLKVRENADLSELGNSFEITAKTGTGYQNGRYTTVTPSQITISDESASPGVAYTVTAAGDETATVGASFDVDISVAADPAVDDWAALEADLTYDDALVTPGILPNSGGVTVSQADGEIKLKISRTGAPASVDEDGVSVVRIPFTASAAGDAVFEIENAKASRQGAQSMTDATAGLPFTITITEAPSEAVTFDDTFAGAPAGFKLLQYALTEKPTVEYTYDGAVMHYAYIDGVHCVTYIVASDVDEETAEALVAATAISVTPNDADINGDAELEIVDAQIAYDLADAVFADDADFSTLSIAQRLKADFNEDGAVTAEDAYAIQQVLHFGAAQ
jgi:hypothetical protein